MVDHGRSDLVLCAAVHRALQGVPDPLDLGGGGAAGSLAGTQRHRDAGVASGVGGRVMTHSRINRWAPAAAVVMTALLPGRLIAQPEPPHSTPQEPAARAQPLPTPQIAIA